MDMKNTFLLLCILLFSGLVTEATAQTPAEKIQQLGLQVPEISPVSYTHLTLPTKRIV